MLSLCPWLSLQIVPTRLPNKPAPTPRSVLKTLLLLELGAQADPPMRRTTRAGQDKAGKTETTGVEETTNPDGVMHEIRVETTQTDVGDRMIAVRAGIGRLVAQGRMMIEGGIIHRKGKTTGGRSLAGMIEMRMTDAVAHALVNADANTPRPAETSGQTRGGGSRHNHDPDN